MINKDLIGDLTNAFGPSGFEEEVCKVVKNYTEALDISNDAMCNVYLKNKHFSGKKPVVMLDAHMDECGFMVQNVLDNGMLSMIMLGGFHLTNLPAHTVMIRNRKGEKIRGIITSKPVHFLSPKEKSSCDLDIEKLYVDVGASSKKEVEEDYGIYPGDPMVPDVKFDYDEKHGIIFGKALDNRIGCACVVETMKALLEEELNVDVVGALAVQEEVGGRGAMVTTHVVKPDLAIVFEGSPADDFYYSSSLAQGSMKKGTQIRLLDKQYISNTGFIRMAHQIGDANGIKYQDAVRRGGSTNAGKISIQGKAVPCLVLGVPCRYVHTHYNYCAMEDVAATVKMAVEVIKGLDDEALDTILKRNLFD